MSKITGPWIIIDLSFLAHKARHSMKNLYIEDVATGVLYGVFEQIMSICSHPRFCSNRMVIVADSKTSFRREAFSGYKIKRQQNKTPEEIKQIRVMKKQVKILRKKILPTMGIPVYGQTGLEGDDIMAMMSEEISIREEQGVMITSDGDLYQCITDKVSWYDPTRDLYYDPKLFKKKYGLSVDHWGMVKAIGGCTSDSIPGLKGVSEKGAIDYLLGNVPSHHKKHKTITDALDSGSIEQWKDLVVLPHKKTKHVRLRDPKYKPEIFFEFCEKYEMYSFLESKGRKQWDRFFKGQFKNQPRRRSLL